ncbi:MAG: nucleotidyltransferase family protein [Candidatus Thorarchaeota archaeon]
MEQRILLDKFLKSVTDLSISIVLTGSQAEGTAGEDSDIDLIVVTETTDIAEKIRRAVNDFTVHSERAILDCKVYSREDLLVPKSTPERFFIWTCLHKGRVLHGKDIIEDIKLSPQIAVDSLWGCIQNIQDACDMLDIGVKFTGACYHLYSALATAFFVEKDVLDSPIPYVTKDTYIRSCLGDEFLKARERYHWVSRRIEYGITQQTLKIPKSVDKKFSWMDYANMHEKALLSVRLLEDLYKRLMSWSESH